MKLTPYLYTVYKARKRRAATKPEVPETWINRRTDNRWLLTCGDGGGERSKYPYGRTGKLMYILCGDIHPILSRRRVLTRNGLSICVIDRREAYRERRAHVGYGQVVSDAEKSVAYTAVRHHNHKKLQAANVAMMNAVQVSAEEVNKLLMANQHNVVGRDPT